MITDISRLPDAAQAEYRRGDVGQIQFQRRFDDWQRGEFVCPRDGCQSFTPVRLAGDDRDLRLCDACERLYEIAPDGQLHTSSGKE